MNDLDDRQEEIESLKEKWTELTGLETFQDLDDVEFGNSGVTFKQMYVFTMGSDWWVKAKLEEVIRLVFLRNRCRLCETLLAKRKNKESIVKYKIRFKRNFKSAMDLQNNRQDSYEGEDLQKLLKRFRELNKYMTAEQSRPSVASCAKLQDDYEKIAQDFKQLTSGKIGLGGIHMLKVTEKYTLLDFWDHVSRSMMNLLMIPFVIDENVKLLWQIQLEFDQFKELRMVCEFRMHKQRRLHNARKFRNMMNGF